jgi:thiol-disulfide isomerase/thioredoxin
MTDYLCPAPFGEQYSAGPCPAFCSIYFGAGGVLEGLMSFETTPGRRAWGYCWFVIAALVFPHALYAVEPGDSAPDLTLPIIANASAGELSMASAQGSRYPLLTLSTYLGKVVYLDFWDSSCTPCRDSLPLLSELRATYRRSDVEIVAVNLDPDPNDALRFLSAHPVSYPVVSDPSLLSSQTYDLSALPTAFFIARDGTVHSVHHGFQNQDIETINNKLTAMIAERDKG